MTDATIIRHQIDDVLKEVRAMVGTDFLTASDGAPEDTDHSPADLLAKCRTWLAASEVRQDDPVRLVHHFACTGGTLISKCIAALPNTLMLSEIDPLSTMIFSGDTRPFFPTDMLSDLYYDPRGMSQEARIEVFLGGLAALRRAASRAGRRLVLRDHAHSQFCTGVDPTARPTLADIVSRVDDPRSVVTVRHPIDSFLSLDHNGWHNFKSFTLNEYARRYLLFLKAHDSIPRFRYEDFVAAPQEILLQIAECLDLSFTPDFEALYSLFPLSGDSGRQSVHIGARERRPVPDKLRDAALQSQAFLTLCEQLGYDAAF